MNEEPITFTEVSYALVDDDENGAVFTTKWGGLAIFSTRVVAEGMRDATIRGYKSRGYTKRISIIPVRISKAAWAN